MEVASILYFRDGAAPASVAGDGLLTDGTTCSKAGAGALATCGSWPIKPEVSAKAHESLCNSRPGHSSLAIHFRVETERNYLLLALSRAQSWFAMTKKPVSLFHFSAAFQQATLISPGMPNGWPTP